VTVVCVAWRFWLGAQSNKGGGGAKKPRGDCRAPDKTAILGARGGYSHTLPIRVCAAQRGRDFEAPDLEPGIYFRGVF